MTVHLSPRRAYGVLAEKNRDNAYYFGPDGFLFTSPHVVTERTLRHPTAILLTADGSSFLAGPPGEPVSHQALVVAPMVPRCLYAEDIPLISFNVQPNHPAFSAFRALPAPGLRGMARETFRDLEDQLLAAYQGRLPLPQARVLFDEVVTRALAHMPERPRPDARVARLLALMQAEQQMSLAEMAAKLGMSYTSASRMFSRAIGISMRSYRLWFKALNAWAEFDSGQTLTDIAHAAGFTDAAHLSREWQHWYGMAPSYLRDARCVRIFSEKYPLGTSPVLDEEDDD